MFFFLKFYKSKKKKATFFLYTTQYYNFLIVICLQERDKNRFGKILKKSKTPENLRFLNLSKILQNFYRMFIATFGVKKKKKIFDNTFFNAVFYTFQ